MANKNEFSVRQEQENKFYYDQSISQILKITFPNLELINFKFPFLYGGYKQLIEIYITEIDKAFFKFNCINRDCIHGGFNLTGEIYEAVRKKTDKITGSSTCEGWQDYERYRAQNHKCLCKLTYEVYFKYSIPSK
jgi:hypothetical protein